MKTKRIIGIGLIPIFAFTLFFGLTNSTWAGLFKYVDENGKTHYTDSKAKIPRKYRDKKKMKTIRGVGERPGKSGGGQAGGATGSQGVGSGAGAGENESAESDPDILSDADVALLDKAKGFLNKEIDFYNNYKDNVMTPTGQRGFVAAFSELLPGKESMASELSKGQSAIVKEISGHFSSTLNAAKDNPVQVRKLSVANSLTRLQSESAQKKTLLDKIKKAKELSEQKKKAAADEKKKDEGEKKAGKPSESKDQKPSSSKSGYKK